MMKSNFTVVPVVNFIWYYLLKKKASQKIETPFDVIYNSIVNSYGTVTVLISE